MKNAFGIWTTLPRTFPYLRPHRKLIFVSILSTFAAAALALAEPWPLALVVDGVVGDKKAPGLIRAIFGEDTDTYKLLMVAVLLGFSLTVLTQAMNVVADWVNSKTEQNMALDLRSDLFRHAQGLSLTFHDSRLTGQLMQQINMQAAAIGGIVVAFPPILQACLTLIGMLVVAAFIDWQVTLASLVAVPLIWYSLGIYGTKIVPRLQRVQSLEWQSLSIVHEAMGMLRVIVSFGRENHEFRRFREQGEVAVDERVKLTVRQTMFSLGVSTATALGTGIVLGFGALHVLQGKITVGELLVLIAYVAAVYQPLEEISNTIGELNEQFVQFNSSLDLLDTEQEIKDAPDAIDIDRARGKIAFDDVHFSYKGRADTLKGVSFTAEPGQRVALVGATGAGKTTLTNLLIRFYDPQSGRVLVDDVDIRKIKLAALRDQISVVLQEPLLFSGTIAANIRYGRLEATDDEVVAAAKAANVHDFIESLPEGYETELGERGAQLSGGERQRVSVARAFVRDAPILILDEPTSSIDSKTESVILDVLDELMEGRTSFMVAHRLSTIRDADLILVMSDGQIVEQGTHDELVEIGGIYRQLYDAQTRQRRRRRAAQAGEEALAASDGAAAPGSDAAAAGASADGGRSVPPADVDTAGDFDVHPATAPPGSDDGEEPAETREEALAAGDFDALGAAEPEAAPDGDPAVSAAPEAGPVPQRSPGPSMASTGDIRALQDVRATPTEALFAGALRARVFLGSVRRTAGRTVRARLDPDRAARLKGSNGGVPPDPFSAPPGHRAPGQEDAELSDQAEAPAEPTR